MPPYETDLINILAQDLVNIKQHVSAANLVRNRPPGIISLPNEKILVITDPNTIPTNICILRLLIKIIIFYASQHLNELSMRKSLFDSIMF